MPGDFERIKEQVDLLGFIEQHTDLSIQHRYNGYVQIEACPFCGGGECFTLYQDDPHYHCYRCGERGDVISLAQQLEKLSSAGEALRYLAGRYGIALAHPEPGSTGEDQKPPAEGPRQRIFEVAARYYQSVLFSENARAALEHLVQVRGHDPELLRAFGVGFSDGSLAKHLSVDFSPDEMLCSGLVLSRQGRLADAFPPGLFVYPHRMPDGTIGDFTCKPFGKGRTPLRLRSEFRVPRCLFWNQRALREKEFLLVEGQNDALSVIGKGAFPSVVATCGQLTSAQVKMLCELAPGKTMYLAFDADEAGGRYREKLLAKLAPIPPKLFEITGESGTRLCTLSWPRGSQEDAKDIDEYLRAQENPRAAFAELLKEAAPLYRPLPECLSLHRSWCENEKRVKFLSPEAAIDQGEILFEWLGGERSFFIEKGGEGRSFLSYKGKIYAIGEGSDFKTLLFDLVRLIHTDPRTRHIIETLECLSRLKNRRIEVSPWLQAAGEGEIFIHTGRDDDLLLRITPRSVTSVPNGRSCLLRRSPKMEPIEFDPGVNVQHALSDLGHLFTDNLATAPEQRYFVTCWLLNIFLMGFVPHRPLLFFSGGSQSGKSTASSLASVLIYGKDWTGTSSAPADFSDSQTNPLTIKDNLEKRYISPQVEQYLLYVVTGAVKSKRKGGTDSENVYERLYTQVIVNAIEPFDLHELINRTWMVAFEPRYKSPGFSATQTLKKLAERRSSILSAFLRLLADEILPGFPERKGFYLRYLNEVYPNHSKARVNEFLAQTFVILEKLLQYVPDKRAPRARPEKRARDLIDELLGGQDASAREAEQDTNQVLAFLDALRSDLLVKHERDVRAFGKEYNLQAIFRPDPAVAEPAQLSFRGSPSELLWSFSTLARNKGRTNPFTSARQLSARIKDSLEILEQAGWHVRRLKVRGKEPYVFTWNLAPDIEPTDKGQL